MPRANAPSFGMPAIEHISIAFREVLGLDSDLAEFMEKHWTVSDFGFPTNRYDRTTLEVAYAKNPMTVIRRKDGYEVLDAGRAYWLAQQLYQPDDLVLVMCVTSGRLRKEQKFQILAADLIVHHALSRTRPHLAHQLYCLHQEIAKAGFIAIAETDSNTGEPIAAGPKCFAIATGYSLDAVRPRGKCQTAEGPGNDGCA